MNLQLPKQRVSDSEYRLNAFRCLSSLFNFFHFPLFCCHRSFFLKKYIFHTCSLHIHLKMCVHVCVCACVWEREIVCMWVSVHVIEISDLYGARAWRVFFFLQLWVQPPMDEQLRPQRETSSSLLEVFSLVRFSILDSRFSILDSRFSILSHPLRTKFAQKSAPCIKKSFRNCAMFDLS